MPKKKQKRHIKKYIVPVTLVFLGISVVVLYAFVFIFFNDYFKQGREQGLNNIAYHISSAVEGLVQEAPTASYSNKQFIHSAKVQFTKTESTSLLYSYSPPGSYGPQDDVYEQQESIQLTSRVLLSSAVDNMKNQIIFDEMINRVPGVQTCSRLFIVTFDDKAPEYYQDYEKIHLKKLLDGRTAYIWKATRDLCIGAEESMGEELLNVINSIQSY